MTNTPLPIGYVEVQRSWQSLRAPRGAAMQDAFDNALAEAVRNAGKPMQSYCTRVEHVGVTTTIYYGFVPLAAPEDAHPPPLDPRNLNEASQVVLGQLVNDGTVGVKERRF